MSNRTEMRERERKKKKKEEVEEEEEEEEEKPVIGGHRQLPFGVGRPPTARQNVTVSQHDNRRRLSVSDNGTWVLLGFTGFY